MEFTLVQLEPVHCNLILTAFNYFDINEYIMYVISNNNYLKNFSLISILRLDVQNGVYQKQYNIRAFVEKPTLKLSINCISYGIIPNRKEFKETFFVECFSHEEIYWALIEIQYDDQKKKFVELKNLDHISQVRGQFTGYGEKEEIVYHLKTNVDKIYYV